MQQVAQYGPQIASVMGTVLSAKGDVDSGNNQDRAGRYRAQQLEQNAGQEIAAATVAAQEEQRKSDLIASRAIAVAAASGGGVVDPTVLKILQGIEAEGALASATQMYNGEEAARGLRTQAKAARYEGRMAKIAGRKKGIGTVLGTAAEIGATWGSSTDKPSSVFKEGGSYKTDGGARA